MNLEEEIKIMEMKENYKLAGFAEGLEDEMPENRIDKTNYVPSTEERIEDISNAEENQTGGIPEEQAIEETLAEEQPAEEHSIISDEIPAPTEEIQPQAEGEGRKKKIIVLGTAAIILIIAIMGLILSSQSSLTGYTTALRETEQATDFNQAFSQYTETQLNMENIIGLKISGTLEGTSAKVKLRINGTEYLVAEIINPDTGNLITGQVTGEETPEYAITTDKTNYLLDETATITISPDTENKSLYISHGEQTQKLDSNVYTPIELGEYQAIALITLENDILRLETNFSVTNETIEPEQTPEEPEPTETTSYEFTGLCTETCTLPENTNPTLIIETAENSTLTITQITTTQQRENNAPVQVQVIPDLTIKAGETATLDLDEYFTDTDGDTVQYDINEIPGIDSTIAQNILTITSTVPGAHTGFIYATDGDKLVTSSTFEMVITAADAGMPDNQTNLINETTNQTMPEPIITADPCSVPDINQRPSYCFAGIEEQVYQDLEAPLENTEGEVLGRFNKFGNLIIKGLIVQEATGEPGQGDFKIGYTETIDYRDATAYTAWISQETGNFYLKGTVHEEQEALQPPQIDSFIIKNKLGIVLAYFNERTGELYLKGNIVQLGKI